MTRKIILFFFISFILPAQIIFSQDNPNKSSDSLKFIVDLPLADIPFNYENGFYFPSMKQSFALSKSFYEAGFYGIGSAINKSIKPEYGFTNILVKNLTYAGFVLVSSYLPLGDSWTHEEYHRAVLKNGQVNSFNDIYNFRFFVETISVSHLGDSELALMKNNYNPDFVRMEEAGMEAQNELVLGLQKDDFFYNMKSDKLFLYWFNLLNNEEYIRLCTTTKADRLTDEFNEREGTNVGIRDAIGLDFTAWTYDLFRSSQSYEQRGTHPSGIGINRYIKNSDLTQEEKNYLRKQNKLNYLSFVDPMLFGFKGFTIKRHNNDELIANANIKHYLTSFGHTVNANFFIKKSDFNLFVTLLNQENYKYYFPGLDIQMINYPLNIKNKKIFINPRFIFWLQPENQDFKTAKSQAGGLAFIQFAYPLNNSLRLTFDLEGKTKGWVAGNVNLDESFNTRFGIIMYFR